MVSIHNGQNIHISEGIKHFTRFVGCARKVLKGTSCLITAIDMNFLKALAMTHDTRARVDALLLLLKVDDGIVVAPRFHNWKSRSSGKGDMPRKRRVTDSRMGI